MHRERKALQGLQDRKASKGCRAWQGLRGRKAIRAQLVRSGQQDLLGHKAFRVCKAM